jgi:hypothetical protein
MIVRSVSLGSRRLPIAARSSIFGSLARAKSTAAVLDDHTRMHPTLKHVPSLPVVGSLIQAYSKVPHTLDPAYAMKTWPKLTEQYGDFYTIGIPGTR